MSKKNNKQNLYDLLDCYINKEPNECLEYRGILEFMTSSTAKVDDFSIKTEKSEKYDYFDTDLLVKVTINKNASHEAVLFSLNKILKMFQDIPSCNRCGDFIGKHTSSCLYQDFTPEEQQKIKSWEEAKARDENKAKNRPFPF